MPIYEYYCEENNTIYQFFAKTLAQGQLTPKCPDNPAFTLKRIQSSFAINRGSGKIEDESSGSGETDTPADSADDARIEAAMGEIEKEFSNVDENDPRAMARMMRRMADITGEKIDGEMEEVVRKLEEGADPDSLEEQLGGGAEDGGDDSFGAGPGSPDAEAPQKEKKHRFRRSRGQPRRDPKLYDYE
ncbi:MAG TPA: FmdB family transcriptional regulator [Opitutaceae bacterium]|nr:FmdB family transcriptional regulator [Opitutaceae bacterium]